MANSPTSMFDEISIALDNVSSAALGAFTPTLRLGVTGLSGAGKTVFITSLVHNLLNEGRLPGFTPSAEGRFLGAVLSEHPDKAIPRFAYEQHLAELTGKIPRWPQSTRTISQLRLTLKFQSKNWLTGMAGANLLHLDIVDYPGEWLLDLPLLSQTYQQWSEQAVQRVNRTKNTSEAKAFHAALKSIDAQSAADEPEAQNLATLFAAYLRGARQPGRAMSTLPPGRFLLPGEMEGSPALTFAPLPVENKNSKNDSLYSLMERRYEAYKTLVVRPFFKSHFARLDRQIVLVDALRALNAGAEAVSDLQEALTSVLTCFRQGSNNPLTWIMARKIDKILFAATKADHVHHTSHGHLQNIIERLVSQAAHAAKFSGAQTKALAIASIRATSQGTIKDKTEVLDCLIGTPEKGEKLDKQLFDGKTEIALFPGDLPENPDSIFQPTLKPGLLNFMRFAPPKSAEYNTQDSNGFPHMRMDKAIDYLLKDWMQ